MLSKRTQQCGLPPVAGGSWRSAHALACELFVPTKSAEVGMFYLSRHVSASVWNKDTLPARAITKAGLCETSLLKQWFFSIARHHFGKLLGEIGLHFNDVWDTFRANAFEKQSAGKVLGQREVVKSNDPWSLNYQPHRVFFRNAILPRPGATTLSLALPINYCVLTLSPKIIACQCISM